MACSKQILALVFVCLSASFNNHIEGKTSAEAEDRQTETKEGRSIEGHSSTIISNFFPNLTTDRQSDHNIHTAGWFIANDNFHGIRARISVWGIPNVNYYSQSSVYIAVMNDDNKRYAMVAGFHVYPCLYSGKTDLRLFVGWQLEEGNACYSTNCNGFVLSGIDGAPCPGGPVRPLSSYDGTDYYVTLIIKKDEKTQDWSLYRNDKGVSVLIGWWPKTLFNDNFSYGTKVVWAAQVSYPKNETSPPMGSGHVACEGEHKAAYMSHFKLFDTSGQKYDPDKYRAKSLTDRTDCFTTDGFYYSYGRGYHFYYGGPPGCRN